LFRKPALEAPPLFNVANPTRGSDQSDKSDICRKKQRPGQPVLEMQEDNLVDIEVNYLRQFARRITALDPGFF